MTGSSRLRRKQSHEREKSGRWPSLKDSKDGSDTGSGADVSFMMEEGKQIEKMAIVGDEKWRDDALAFTAKGFRPTAIEFFPASRMNEATYMADVLSERALDKVPVAKSFRP